MSWFEHFFEGLATDVWRGCVTPEQTAEEVAFLKKHLRLSKGAAILDVPCADGRLAVPLAQEGFKVTGVDLSPRCLESAQAAGGKLPLEFVKTDMRKLPWHSAFDGAFCMGNSFGYFNAADTNRFLTSVYEALRPESFFLLDTCLAAETFFTTGGTKEWVEVDDIVMLMENQYDPREGRLDSRFVFINGSLSEEHETQHWIFTAAEICRMCENAGFEIVNLFGSLQGEEFSLGSERLLLQACKPPAP